MDRADQKNGLFEPSGCLSEKGLLAFIGGGLDDGQEERVLKHLSECEFCATATEGMELLMKEKNGDAVRKMVESLHRRGMDRMKKRVEDQRISRRFLHLGWISAAAGIALLAGFYFLSKNHLPSGMKDMAVTTAEDKESPNSRREQAETPGENENKGPGQAVPSLKPAGDAKTIQLSTDLMTEAEKYVKTVVVEPDNENKFIKADSAAFAYQDAVVSKKSLQLGKNEDSPAMGGVTVQSESVKRVSKSTVRNYAVAAEAKEAADAEEAVYSLVEEMPQFPGGNDSLAAFIKRNLRWPASGSEIDVNGKVYVSFTITRTGKIKNAAIQKGIEKSFDEEALRVISIMPRWIPGRKAAKAVDVQYTLPIEFHLK